MEEEESQISDGALVIGGTYRGLGVVRSLGRRGIPVWLVTDPYMVASVSRYVRRSLHWPSSHRDRISLLRALAEHEGIRGWTVFSSEDEASELISRNHELLSEYYRLTTPPWDVMSQLHDKRRLHKLGARLGIEQPRTLYAVSRAELETLALHFPAILKPAYRDDTNPFTHAKAWKVSRRQELLERYDQALADVAPDMIMIQDLIPGLGNDYAFAALCQNGRPLASLVAWRPRQYPIDFGRSSSYVETVDVPEIEEQATRLLAATGVTGLAHVGFKLDPRDGRYKLLDVNLRAWGSHTLGTRAGVDFSYLLWRCVHGEPVSRMRAPGGLRWIRPSMDLVAAARLMARGALRPAQYVSTLRWPMEFAVASLDDPLPMILDIPLLLARVVIRRVRRIWTKGAFRDRPASELITPPRASSRVR